MNNLTNNEAIILESIRVSCADDYSTSVEQVSIDTGINALSVRGVIGSLVKKNLVHCEEREVMKAIGFVTVYDIFYRTECGHILSFGELT